MPSPSSRFRYLARSDDAAEEERRQEHQAFIPAPKGVLAGLGKVNGDQAAFVQRHRPRPMATLDMDATLMETHKGGALYSYQGYKAYQPLTTYWAEQGLVLHSEFRDGPASEGCQQGTNSYGCCRKPWSFGGRTARRGGAGIPTLRHGGLPALPWKG